MSKDFVTPLMKLAAAESVASGSAQITPSHLLIALSKLSEEEALSRNDDQSVALKREFESMGIEPRRFRRNLRALISKTKAGSQSSIMHRSDTTKAVLELGDMLGKASGESNSAVYLFRAIFLLLADVLSANNSRLADRDKGLKEDDIPYEL